MHCAAKVGKARCGSEALRQAAAPSGSLPEKLFASPARVPNPPLSRLLRAAGFLTAAGPAVAPSTASADAQQQAQHRRPRLRCAAGSLGLTPTLRIVETGTHLDEVRQQALSTGGCITLEAATVCISVYGSGGSPQAGRLRECLRCPRACHLVPRLLRGTEVAVSARSGSGSYVVDIIGILHLYVQRYVLAYARNSDYERERELQ